MRSLSDFFFFLIRPLSENFRLFGTNVSMKMKWNSKETVFDFLCISGYDSSRGF